MSMFLHLICTMVTLSQASTEDLFVRLDFEKVKDLSTNDSFSNSGSYKNVAPNTSLYGDTFVTMSNFCNKWYISL